MTGETQQYLLDEIEWLKAQLAECRQSEPPPAEQEYIVKSGDSLWKIATKYYGDGSEWPRIYKENKKVIGDNPDLIHPGQKLVIPPLEG